MDFMSCCIVYKCVKVNRRDIFLAPLCLHYPSCLQSDFIIKPYFSCSAMNILLHHMLLLLMTCVCTLVLLLLLLSYSCIQAKLDRKNLSLHFYCHFIGIRDIFSSQMCPVEVPTFLSFTHTVYCTCYVCQ